MDNFLSDLDAVIGTEEVLGVVLGGKQDVGSDYWMRSMLPHPPREFFERVQLWADARPWLDREYDTGFGGADCWPLYLWTPTRVVFVHEYDGATGVVSVPRNPVPGRPGYGGLDA